MQKFIAKYGLAAHLAILAVAPLFLFPFADAHVVSVVLLWLSVPAALWTVLEPSIIGGESLSDARRRVAKAIARDPLFWVMLVLVLFSGVRALNSGIAMAYNAETSSWSVASPVFPLLPGSVGKAGFLPFAGLVALSVLLQGCRHSLGRSARMAYLFASSALSGLAAALALIAAHNGLEGARAAIGLSTGAYSFVGLAFGIHLLAGTVALVAAFERRWNFATLFLFPAIGGNAAGLFSFSPAYVSAAVAICELILSLYVFVFACIVLHAAVEFKLLVVFGVSLVLGGLLTVVLLPANDCDLRVQAYVRLEFFTQEFWKVRSALAAIALKSWISSLWTGTGIASFPLDFRFNAAAADWQLLPRGTVAIPFGWWLMLAERGVVGTVAFFMPAGLMLFTYFRRMGELFGNFVLPHPSCLLVLAAALLAAVGCFDCSILRIDVLMAASALLVIASAAFHKSKKVKHG